MNGAAGSAPAPTDPEARLLATACGQLALSEEGPPGAPTVLCIHGIPGSRRDFRYLAPGLSGAMRVVRLDMPGFGDSPDDGRPSLARWSEVAVAAADALGRDRFYLLAHSFGGGAALLAAGHAGDRVEGLGLLAAMGLRRHRAFLLPPAAYQLLGGCLAVPGLRGPFAAATRAIYRRIGLPGPAPGDLATPRRHVRLLASVEFDALRAAARRISAPTVLVHASDDRLVEAAIARELAAAVAGAELVMLGSGGHHLNRTRVAEVVAALASRWGQARAAVGAGIG